MSLVGGALNLEKATVLFFLAESTACQQQASFSGQLAEVRQPRDDKEQSDLGVFKPLGGFQAFDQAVYRESKLMSRLAALFFELYARSLLCSLWQSRRFPGKHNFAACNQDDSLQKPRSEGLRTGRVPLASCCPRLSARIKI